MHYGVGMLPNEDDARVAVAAQFRREFAFAREVLDHCVAVVNRDRLRVEKRRGLNDTVLFVALGLYTKACKQARSILTLCEGGLGEDAHALTRALFETTLALNFILRPRVTIRRGGIRLPPVSGKPLTTGFRADLYLARFVVERNLMVQDLARTPGWKRTANKIDRASLASEAAKTAQSIGPEWTKRLKQSRTYSGVSLRDTAFSLGYGQAWVVLYRTGSWSTHANDIEQYVTLRETSPTDPTLVPEIYLQPGPAWVPQALIASAGLLVDCLSLLNSRFGLRHGAWMASHERRVATWRLSQGEPKGKRTRLKI